MPIDDPKRSSNGPKRRSLGQLGFTLIELVMVIAMLGVLAVFAAPRMFNSGDFYARGFHDETLALLREILRSPTFPAAEFEQFRNEWVTGVEEQRRQPDAIAQNELTRYDNPFKKGDVRYAANFAEQIEAVKAIKVGDLKAFHEQFYGGATGQMALVGDFDAKTTQESIKTLLGDFEFSAESKCGASDFLQ